MSEPFPAKRSFLSSCVFVLAMTLRTTVSHGRIYPYPFPPGSSSSSTMGFPCQFACLSVVFSVVVTTHSRHGAAQSSASWTGCSHTRGRGDSLDLEPRDWREMGYQPLSTACLLRSGARVCLPFGYLLTHTSHTDSSLFYFRLLVHQLVCFFCFQLMQTNSTDSCSLHCPGMR